MQARFFAVNNGSDNGDTFSGFRRQNLGSFSSAYGPINSADCEDEGPFVGPADASRPSSSAEPPNSAGRMQAVHEWKQTRNWDQFYRTLYEYYSGRGLWTIVMAKLLNLMTMLFVVSFATFLVGCVDHTGISSSRGHRTLSDAILDGCPVISSTFHRFSLLAFGCFWLWQLFRYMVVEWPLLRSMQRFVNTVLRVPDHDLQWIQWSEVLSRVESVHHEVFGTQVTSLDIVNRIMRRDNYLIALFNKDILNLNPVLPVRHSLPPSLTKVMEWNLNICLMDYVFGEGDQGSDDSVKPAFLRDNNRRQHVAELKRRFLYMGIFNLIMMPFTFVFLSIYALFRYGQEYHRNPTQLGARSFSSLAKWKFRDFNELPTFFYARIASCHPFASKYLSFYSQPQLEVIARFISYISGAIALSLTVLTLLDDDILLNFEISPGRSTLWYIGLFGLIWSASRSLIPDPRQTNQIEVSLNTPEKTMAEIVKITHYYPKHWHETGFHSKRVYREFSELYTLRLLQFIMELASIVLAPFILIFQLPRNVSQLLDFFKQFTVHVEGVGKVCTYSMFDFRKLNHVGSEARPATTTLIMNQTEDKMKMSMINFRREYESSARARRSSSAEDKADPISPSAYIDQILEEERQLAQLQNGTLHKSVYVPPPLPIVPPTRDQDEESELSNQHELEDQDEYPLRQIKVATNGE